jgi:site-specific DNA recombinase
MPSTNGHGPKKAVLYARVSTDEQARSGYSLAQQIEALREYAAREGYEVLEEVADPGQSGASLERPGMDRVRDLVATDGVSVVLAQDRDRFSREPAYTYLLRREFEEHNCELRSLNDRGDGSPEDELTDGILDQLAKYERAKIAERSRRGKLRKAREGKVIANNGVDYGFRYNDTRDGYEVDAETMPVVRRIFAMVADGSPLNAVAERLTREGVGLPYSRYRGVKGWNVTFIRDCIIGDDVYRPHTFDEISALVRPEVASRLDLDKSYGIWWFNRRRSKITQISVPDGNGGRRYRQRVRYALRPREEWIAVPVPDSGVSREIVDTARQAIKHNRAPSNAGRRFWELSGGFVHCGLCGHVMDSHTTANPGRPRVLLLRLPNPLQEGRRGLLERQVLGCGQGRNLGMGGSH